MDQEQEVTEHHYLFFRRLMSSAVIGTISDSLLARFLGLEDDVFTSVFKCAV